MDLIAIPARAASDPRLTAHAVRLLLAISRRAHQGIVDASNLSLATDATISTRTVRRLLAQLRDQGYVEWLSPGPRGGIPLRLLWLAERKEEPFGVALDELRAKLIEHDERMASLEATPKPHSEVSASDHWQSSVRDARRGHAEAMGAQARQIIEALHIWGKDNDWRPGDIHAEIRDWPSRSPRLGRPWADDGPPPPAIIIDPPQWDMLVVASRPSRQPMTLVIDGSGRPLEVEARYDHDERRRAYGRGVVLDAARLIDAAVIAAVIDEAVAGLDRVIEALDADPATSR